MHQSDSDILLWKKVQTGSKESFDKLFQLYVDFLYNYGIKFGADSALTEDCIQDFFLYLWKKREHIFIKDSLKFYFLKSYRRILLKKIQDRKKKTFLFKETGEYPFLIQISQEDVWIQTETQAEHKQKINQAIDALSPRQKEAIYLRYYENFANEEISDIMNISIGSLYKLISASFKKLRKELR